MASEVLAQWPSAAYPIAIVAAVAALARPTRAGNGAPVMRPVMRYGVAAAPWLALAMALTLFAQMTVPPVAIRMMQDPLSRFFGWAQLASDTHAIMRQRQAGYIATNEHSIAAMLQFYLRDAAVFQTSEAVRYDFMPTLDQARLRHGSGIYLAVAPDDDLARLHAHFDSVQLISTIWRNRNGDPIEAYRVYELKGYRGGVPY